MDALDALRLEEKKTEVRSAEELTNLDQNAFLTIFLAQLQNQDPLNPQEADALAAQLAQFSQLEQSLRMTGELEGVNSRLDRLIESSGAPASFQPDPVALLGREVEIGLRLPAAGESQPLIMELDEDSSSLLIEVQDREGNALALAEILGTSESGDPVDLPAGSYRLVFRDGEPRLVVPDGGESEIAFTPYRAGGRQIDPGAPPLEFDPATTYQFSVIANGLSSGSFTPRTNSSGTVDGIRIVDGQPILSVSGIDVEPSQILRIR
ncbi:MAG: flagellar hook assembly protein FlgD [Myxococcota bacterium]